MTIYLAISEYEDLEYHMDIEGLYFSKEDLFKDFEKIKNNKFDIYKTDKSSFINEAFEKCNIKELEKEFIKHNEYNEYLRLKEKYERLYYVNVHGESITIDEDNSEYTMFKGTMLECKDFIANL